MLTDVSQSHASRYPLDDSELAGFFHRVAIGHQIELTSQSKNTARYQHGIHLNPLGRNVQFYRSSLDPVLHHRAPIGDGWWEESH